MLQGVINSDLRVPDAHINQGYLYGLCKEGGDVVIEYGDGGS